MPPIQLLASVENRIRLQPRGQSLNQVPDHHVPGQTYS